MLNYFYISYDSVFHSMKHPPTHAKSPSLILSARASWLASPASLGLPCPHRAWLVLSFADFSL